MRREISAPGVAEPISHYCDAVEANGFLFVSGCPATDENGDLVGGDDTVAQCEQVLRNLGAILQAAGCAPGGRRQGQRLPHRRRRPPAHQPAAPGVLRRVAPGEHARRREELPVPGMKVEIEAVAVLPDRFGRAQQS